MVRTVFVVESRPLGYLERCRRKYFIEVGLLNSYVCEFTFIDLLQQNSIHNMAPGVVPAGVPAQFMG